MNYLLYPISIVCSRIDAIGKISRCFNTYVLYGGQLSSLFFSLTSGYVLVKNTVFSRLRQAWQGFKKRKKTKHIRLQRRQVYILPTRQGLWFAVILFVMLLGSMNYNNSMGYTLTFLLVSLLLISMFHAHRMLLGLRINTLAVSPIFLGETIHFPLHIDNRDSHDRFSLSFHLGKTRMPLDNTQLLTHVENDTYYINLSAESLQRGRQAVDVVTVSSQYPLGFFHVWAYLYFDMNALVYPAPEGHKNLPVGGHTVNQGEGSPYQRGGDDFIGYRDYHIGDSLHHVDWKIVARQKGWHIKQFGGTGAATVWLTWEDVAHINHLEQALSQLCLWVLIADSQGAQYGLRLPHCEYQPDAGELHRERCLKALALFGHTS